MNSKLLPSEERLVLMQKGAEQLHIWLKDIARTGILEHDLSEDSLSEVSARMVDAKMGSIARRIRQLGSLDKGNPRWIKHLQDQLSLMYLFVINFKRLSHHTLPMQLTLLTWAGYSIRKSDLDPNKGIEDLWYLVGRSFHEEEQLRARRCWFSGIRTKRYALVLDFAFGNSKFEVDYEFGKGYRGRLNYYPSTFPLRAALFLKKTAPLPNASFPTYDSIDKFLDQYATALSKNPWISAFPCSLSRTSVIQNKDRFILVDRDKRIFPLKGEDDQLWSLVSISGGDALTVFGEWSGHNMQIHTYVEKGRIIAL